MWKSTYKTFHLPRYQQARRLLDLIVGDIHHFAKIRSHWCFENAEKIVFICHVSMLPKSQMNEWVKFS